MEIHFDTFKYDMVKIYVMKIRENDPYMDPETGIVIYRDSLLAGIKEANAIDSGVIQRRDELVDKREVELANPVRTDSFKWELAETSKSIKLMVETTDTDYTALVKIKA